MKSRAHIKSHPLHPILVTFPIAFFTGTLLFDVLGMLQDNPALAETGGYLNIAGVAAAVLAAIPGIIDFRYTVPPDSSAHKRAARHGLMNTTVLLLFAFVLWYRHADGPTPGIMIALEAVAVGLMLTAGWLGGTLVHRNQIGVDVRYADAGKWKEVRLPAASGEVAVAGATGLKQNQMMLVHAGDKRIVVARAEDGFVAFDDRCPHKGGSLAGGAMMCGTVQCPWHGSQFDVRSGALRAGPARDGIRTYPMEVRGAEAFIRL